jgi:hypothetical protein
MENQPEQQSKDVQNTKPNEISGVHFSSAIKIFDPNNEEVYVQIRGDE